METNIVKGKCNGFEVLYAICNARGYTLDELESKRLEKSINKGGFEKRLFLEYMEVDEADYRGNVSDKNALKKWSLIPDDFKEKILNNVFCINCGVTLIEDLKAGQSRPRNRGIASEFVAMKIIEQCGTGIPRIIEMCKKYDLNAPELVEIGMDFRVNLYTITI